MIIESCLKCIAGVTPLAMQCYKFGFPDIARQVALRLMFLTNSQNVFGQAHTKFFRQYLYHFLK